MRWCVSIGAALVAATLLGGDVAGIAAPNPNSRFGDQPVQRAADKDTMPTVDVELVLATPELAEDLFWAVTALTEIDLPDRVVRCGIDTQGRTVITDGFAPGSSLASPTT